MTDSIPTMVRADGTYPVIELRQEAITAAVVQTRVNGVDGANLLALSGSLGGASLGRGRWVITARPAGGTPRSLSLVVV